MHHADRIMILLVDDRPENLLAYQASLAELDLELVFARSGTEALKQVLAHEFALVLLDVNMPRVDGIETLRRLKQFDPECVVIMLTSLVNRQTVEECLQLGAVAYLRKDNPPDDMASRLKKIVDDCFDPKPAKLDPKSAKPEAKPALPNPK